MREKFTVAFQFPGAGRFAQNSANAFTIYGCQTR
jgi:hypothetical protein